MVRPDLLFSYIGSPLFVFWSSPNVLVGLFILMLVALAAMTLGVFSRGAYFIATPLVLAFHHANPMIAHEPHPLANLLLWVLLFFPIESRFVAVRTPGMRFFEETSSDYRRGAVIVGLAFLGVYYFFAGVKKLPDVGWLKGTALFDLLHWSPLKKDNVVVDAMRASPRLAMLGNYATLLFEISFPFVLLTQFRRTLALVGILFHGAILLTLDVGHFTPTMLAWYPLLLVDINDSA
ncbi:MAG: HTTM domain-containing protein [Myxococcota bacterium]